MATQYDPILKDSTGQAIVSKLEGIKNAINPTAENIPITTIEGMEAENVQEGLEELKQSLTNKLDFYIISSSGGTSGARTDVQNFCDSLTSKIPIAYTLDAGSIGFGFMYKASSNYALVIYYQYANTTMVKLAMTKYGGVWSDWFNI